MADSHAPITLKVGPTNAYLLKLADGFLLIDTSFPGTFGKFLKGIDRLGVSLPEIHYLLLTHSHDDHAGLAAEIKQKSHCSVIAHERSVEALGAGRAKDLGRFVNRRALVLMGLYGLVKRRTFGFPPIHLDDHDLLVAGDDDEVLRSLGLDGRIIATPGHTDDGLSVILSNGDAFVGDACMSAFGFLHLRPPLIKDWGAVIGSWDALIGSGARTIHPGHGRPFPVEELIRSRERYGSPDSREREP